MTKNDIKRIVLLSLREDLPLGDITTNSIVPSENRSRARIFVKENAVLCGLPLAQEIFKQLSPKMRLRCLVHEGSILRKNTTILTLEGRTRAILTGERTALNFLSYLSAIATQTRRFVDQVHPYKVKILDTRKTTPTLRFLERYAVRIGGGVNHRENLSQAVMIKDNHWMSSRELSMDDEIGRIKRLHKVPVIVEVDNLKQLRAILNTKTDIILLDNMSPALVRKAVAMRKKLKSSVLFEVSGGINIGNVREYAKTGVERISVGELTHSRRSVDFSLEIMR